MNTQDFIESGILESYLLGFASEEEQHAINQQLLASSAFSDYVGEFEQKAQRYFLKNAIPPPPAIRDVIQLRTDKTDIEKAGKHTYYDVPKEKQFKDEYLNVEVNDTYIKVHKWWRPAFVAVFVLSKIFLIAGLYYYFKSVNQEKELEKLRTEISLPQR